MKLTFITVLLFYVFILVANTSCSPKDDDPEPNYQTISELVTETVSKEKIPGMIAAIADSNGIITIASAGVRKIGSLEQITNSDLFHIGSCTKAMTSALMATCVANNELKWETTLIDVFPELKETIHENYHTVTPRQLLTHTAGIESNAKDWSDFQDLAIKECRLALLKENLKEPSKIKQGVFNYSNLGYMVAACMAERITGEKWETLLKNRIFEPLGMSSAGFGFPGTKDKIEQPWGHTKFLSKWNPVQNDNPVALGPAGTVHCSFDDWAKFIALFLKKGDNTPLSQSLIAYLTSPIGDYACGWMVGQRDWGNGMVLTHNGSNTMWYVSVWVAPEINRAFMVGINSCDDQTFGICDKVTGVLIAMDKK